MNNDSSEEVEELKKMAQSRNYNLDILRILAAAMVFTVHLGVFFPWIYEYTWTGFYGVMLFFVLSGYLTMCSVESSKSVGEYYKKRVVRIVPLYFSVLIVDYICILVENILANIMSGAEIFTGVFSYGGPCSVKYLRYFGFLNMFIPSDNFSVWNNMEGFWTMSCFAFFYLVTPIFYKLIKKFLVFLPILAVTLYFQRAFVSWLEAKLNDWVPWADNLHDFALETPISMLYCYMLGIAVYLAHKDKKQFLFVVLCGYSMIFNEFKWFAWEILMAVMVLAAIELPSIAGDSLRAHKVIKTCSAVSFPLYLTHLIVLRYFTRLQDFLVPYIRHKGFLGLTMIVCCGVAYLVWRFVATPLEGKMRKAMKV